MSASDINTKVQQAITAQEAGDYAAALTYLRSAKILLAATPDATTSRGSSLTWDRTSIDQMITQLTALNNAAKARRAGGPQRTKINYVNPCED